MRTAVAVFIYHVGSVVKRSLPSSCIRFSNKFYKLTAGRNTAENETIDRKKWKSLTRTKLHYNAFKRAIRSPAGQLTSIHVGESAILFFGGTIFQTFSSESHQEARGHVRDTPDSIINGVVGLHRNWSVKTQQELHHLRFQMLRKKKKRS